jgi:hypothetical protein
VVKHWERVRLPQRCGLCGELLRPGEAVAIYDGTVGMRRRPLRLLRCGPCEGGAPPDLPADIVHEETPQPAIDFTRLGLLPITFTGRQPGEDDQ